MLDAYDARTPPYIDFIFFISFLPPPPILSTRANFHRPLRPDRIRTAFFWIHWQQRMFDRRRRLFPRRTSATDYRVCTHTHTHTHAPLSSARQRTASTDETIERMWISIGGKKEGKTLLLRKTLPISTIFCRLPEAVIRRQRRRRG